MELTKKNTLSLPVYPIFGAPKYYEGVEKTLWFEDADKSSENFDNLVEQALVVECIGDRECPMSGDWMYFVVAGSIIAALTGKYIVLPNRTSLGWWDNFERFIWEVLWKSYHNKENKDNIDQNFMGAVFRLFLPMPNIINFNFDGQFSNIFTNRFINHWVMGRHPRLVGFGTKSRLDLGYIEEVRRKMSFFPDKVLESLDKVSRYSPVMLKIALDYTEKGTVVIE